ncbi:mechanosensitive ion channel family protein [Colwelliaceae bacterium 6471]
MNAIITDWLSAQGMPNQYVSITALIIGAMVIFALAHISYYIAKHQILHIVHKLVLKSQNTWDDLLLEQKVFSRISFLVPLILLLVLVPIFLPTESLVSDILIVFAKVMICFQVALSISALLNVIRFGYRQKATNKYLPLDSVIQVIKLVVFLVATILALSFILNRSPIYLLSGLGALTAVLLLVFQDTIKGLVASIQISANKMVAPGDWVELPNYGADGDVIEIGLNTVKVRNFDKTVTTVPTYALMSGSFKNWRDMFNAGGRRIKRTIIIDIRSIKFYNNDEINELSKIDLIADYLNKKRQEISASGQTANDINARQLTNIGTFRAYIEAYLHAHNKVNHEMTCMVRQLTATSSGLPLELYFFCSDQNWVNYEAIQADIFDHLFAMAPHFSLRIFQHPSGHDWQRN